MAMKHTRAHRWYADPRVSIHPEIRKEESLGFLARGERIASKRLGGRRIAGTSMDTNRLNRTARSDGTLIPLTITGCFTLKAYSLSVV